MAARRPARDARRCVPLPQAYRLFGSNPLVMVTSVGQRGPNVMTCAWCTPYDFNPPHLLLVIDPASLTAANIRATGIFAVHIVNEALARLAVRCGSVSGRTVDKFARFGIVWRAGRNGAPVLADAPAYLECALTDAALAKKQGIIIGRGTYAAAFPAVFRRGCWQPRAAAGRLLHHLGGNRFLRAGGTLTVTA